MRARHNPTFLLKGDLPIELGAYANISCPQNANILVPPSSHLDIKVIVPAGTASAVEVGDVDIPRTTQEGATALMVAANDAADFIKKMFATNTHAQRVGTLMSPEEIKRQELLMPGKELTAGWYPEKWKMAKYIRDLALTQHTNLLLTPGPI